MLKQINEVEIVSSPENLPRMSIKSNLAMSDIQRPMTT